MKRSAAVLFLLLLAVGSTFLAQAKKKSDATGVQAQFEGAWELVSIHSRRADGEWTPYQGRFGPNPVGMIIFDASGHMSVQIMNPDRPTFPSDDFSERTAEELRAILAGYTAYFGTYEIDARGGFLIHRRLGHLNPNRAVIDAKRFFELAGGELTLTVAPKRHLRLTWRRVGA